MRARELIATARYPRFVLAATTGRLSNEMFTVAGLLFVLEETGSATIAGLCVAALTLPSLVTGPLLASRVSARMIRLDQAIAAGSLAALIAATGSVPDWALPLLVLPAGATFPLSTAGFTTLIPQVVPDALRRDANAVEAASYNFALVAGPAIAGGLSLAAGPETALGVELALKLATLAIASFPGMRVQSSAGIRAGFAHVASRPPLLAVTIGSSLALAGRGLFTVAFPLLAVQSLDTGSGSSGLLWAALAAGSATSVLAIGGRARVSPARLVLVSTACAGALIAALPAAGALASAAGLVFLAGIALGPSLAATLTVRQEESPDGLQPQVMMIGASLKTASFAVGAAAAGPLSASISVDELLLGASAAHLAGAAIGWLALTRDR